MATTAPELKTQVRVLNRAITAFDVTTAPTIRAVRKTPMTDDQPAMPFEQRGWGHQPEPAQFLRRRTPECGQHRPIQPGQSRPRNLTAKDSDLMAQQQDLCLLPALRPAQQHEQPNKLPIHDQIQQARIGGST